MSARTIKIFVAIAVVLTIIFVAGRLIPEQMDAERVRAAEVSLVNDPVALYHAEGIRSCSSEARYLSEGARAAALDTDDLAQTSAFFRAHFGDDVAAVLYVNTPDPVPEENSGPIFLPLKKDRNTYCVIGISDGDSVGNIDSIKRKYQPLLNR